jgi:hypothetical protein
VGHIPAVAINSALLRKHFRELTRELLSPLQTYFKLGVAQSDTSRRGFRPYDDAARLIPKFDADRFMNLLITKGASVMEKAPLLSEICGSRGHSILVKLSEAFLQSAHFRPWFQRRRNSLMHELMSIHRSLLLSTSNDALLASAGQHTNDILSLLVRVRRKMLAELEKMKEGVDYELLTQMKRHERFLRSALPSTLAARVEKEVPLPFEEAVQGEKR